MTDPVTIRLGTDALRVRFRCALVPKYMKTKWESIRTGYDARAIQITSIAFRFGANSIHIRYDTHSFQNVSNPN